MDGAASSSPARGGMKNSGGGRQGSKGRAGLRQRKEEGTLREVDPASAPGLGSQPWGAPVDARAPQQPGDHSPDPPCFVFKSSQVKLFLFVQILPLNLCCLVVWGEFGVVLSLLILHGKEGMAAPARAWGGGCALPPPGPFPPFATPVLPSLSSHL